jgi:hypothetical protein
LFFAERKGVSYHFLILKLDREKRKYIRIFYKIYLYIEFHYRTSKILSYSFLFRKKEFKDKSHIYTMYSKPFNDKLNEELNSLSYLREKSIKSLIKTYETLLNKFNKPLITKRTYFLCLCIGYTPLFRDEIHNKLNVQYQKDYGRDFNKFMDDDNNYKQQELIRELIKTYKSKIEQILNKLKCKSESFNTYMCECGKNILKHNKNRHLKTTYHLNFVNGIIKENTFKCKCGIEVLNKNKHSHLLTKRHNNWELCNNNIELIINEL